MASNPFFVAGCKPDSNVTDWINALRSTLDGPRQMLPLNAVMALIFGSHVASKKKGAMIDFVEDAVHRIMQDQPHVYTKQEQLMQHGQEAEQFWLTGHGFLVAVNAWSQKALSCLGEPFTQQDFSVLNRWKSHLHYIAQQVFQDMPGSVPDYIARSDDPEFANIQLEMPTAYLYQNLEMTFSDNRLPQPRVDRSSKFARLDVVKRQTTVDPVTHEERHLMGFENGRTIFESLARWFTTTRSFDARTNKMSKTESDAWHAEIESLCAIHLMAQAQQQLVDLFYLRRAYRAQSLSGKRGAKDGGDGYSALSTTTQGNRPMDFVPIERLEEMTDIVPGKAVPVVWDLMKTGIESMRSVHLFEQRLRGTRSGMNSAAQTPMYGHPMLSPEATPIIRTTARNHPSDMTSPVYIPQGASHTQTTPILKQQQQQQQSNSQQLQQQQGHPHLSARDQSGVGVSSAVAVQSMASSSSSSSSRGIVHANGPRESPTRRVPINLFNQSHTSHRIAATVPVVAGVPSLAPASASISSTGIPTGKKLNTLTAAASPTIPIKPTAVAVAAAAAAPAQSTIASSILPPRHSTSLTKPVNLGGQVNGHVSSVGQLSMRSPVKPILPPRRRRIDESLITESSDNLLNSSDERPQSDDEDEVGARDSGGGRGERGGNVNQSLVTDDEDDEGEQDVQDGGAHNHDAEMEDASMGHVQSSVASRLGKRSPIGNHSPTKKARVDVSPIKISSAHTASSTVTPKVNVAATAASINQSVMMQKRAELAEVLHRDEPLIMSIAKVLTHFTPKMDGIKGVTFMIDELRQHPELVEQLRSRKLSAMDYMLRQRTVPGVSTQ